MTAGPLLLVAVSSLHAQVGTLKPIDEAGADTSFVSFRQRLLSAIERRDTSFLLGSIDPAIRLSFGDDNGIGRFREVWKLDSPVSPVWHVLNRILSMGGKYENRRFTAPYVFAHWPASIDAFEHGAVTGTGVAVRERPNVESAVLTRLSHTIVKVDEWLNHDHDGMPLIDGWVKVRLSDGRAGYMSGRYVYSPVGYRAMFYKTNGAWRLSLLVAGD